jgi:hypothetical protein
MRRFVHSVLFAMTLVLFAVPVFGQVERGEDPDGLTKSVDAAIAEPATNPWYMTPTGIVMIILAGGVLTFLIGAAIRRGGKDPVMPRGR